MSIFLYIHLFIFSYVANYRLLLATFVLDISATAGIHHMEQLPVNSFLHNLRQQQVHGQHFRQQLGFMICDSCRFMLRESAEAAIHGTVCDRYESFSKVFSNSWDSVIAMGWNQNSCGMVISETQRMTSHVSSGHASSNSYLLIIQRLLLLSELVFVTIIYKRHQSKSSNANLNRTSLFFGTYIL